MLISGASEKHAEYNGCAAVLRKLHPSDIFYMARFVHCSARIQIRTDWVSLLAEHHCLLDWCRLTQGGTVSQEVLEPLKNKALVQFGSPVSNRKPKEVDLSKTFTSEALLLTGIQIRFLHPADANDSSARLLALVLPSDSSKIYAVRPEDLMVLPGPVEYNIKTSRKEDTAKKLNDLGDIGDNMKPTKKEEPAKKVKLFKCKAATVSPEQVTRWETCLVWSSCCLCPPTTIIFALAKHMFLVLESL